jgi:hypothetical protein
VSQLDKIFHIMVSRKLVVSWLGLMKVPGHIPAKKDTRDSRQRRGRKGLLGLLLTRGQKGGENGKGLENYPEFGNKVK